jgi:Tfp pilus assembly protein PilO
MRGRARDGIIMCGIVVVMTAAGFQFGYRPSARKLEQIREETSDVRASLLADSEKASAVPQLLRQVEEMKGKHKDFDRRLPRRAELGGFLREISEDLSQESLSNQTIEPGRPTQEDVYFTLPIVMRFQGSYLSLVRFLERINRFERLTRVQKLSIIPGAAENQLDITMQMNIYFTES